MRAPSDLSGILDSMANGISTLKAADNGLTAITTAVESMKATVTQARQDASFKSTSYSVALTTPAATDVLTVSGGAVGTTPVNVDLTNSHGRRARAALQLCGPGLQQRRHLRGDRCTFSRCAQRRHGTHRSSWR